jgi:hypothetical protein
MNAPYKYVLFSLLLLKVAILPAQEIRNIPVNPSIPIEFLIGNNRINYLSSMNRNITGKLGFFNLTSAAVDYKNTSSQTEIVLINAGTYKLFNGLQLMAGAQWHYKKGLVPLVGFQWVYANPKWLIVYSPALHFLPYNSIENMFFVEYKHPLKNKLRWFNRLQGMYEQNYEGGSHDRSFVNIRTGIGFGKITLGIGHNLDFYGPAKIRKNNTGLLVRIDL